MWRPNYVDKKRKRGVIKIQLYEKWQLLENFVPTFPNSQPGVRILIPLETSSDSIP